MSARLVLTKQELRQEVLLNLQQLVSLVDVNGIMRSYLSQACLLQGAQGGLFVVNPRLSKQTSLIRGDYTIQTVGTMKAELALHGLWQSSEVKPEWNDIVTIAQSLGWTSTNPRFSVSFGEVGSSDYCCMFGFVVRSNFGDVLGFIFFVTTKVNPFDLADRNLTAITELTIYRILESFGIKQTYMTSGGGGNSIRESAGRVFPALNEVYSSSVHDLNGALAAVAMQIQLLSATAAAAAGSGDNQRTGDRTEKMIKSMQRADEFLAISDAMTKTLVGEVESTSMRDLLGVSIATGMESLKAFEKVLSSVEDIDLPIEQSEKILCFWLCHNLVRLGRISLEELESEVPDPRLKTMLTVFVQGDLVFFELKMQKYTNYLVNVEKFGMFRPFQLGRRLNPPRRMIAAVLDIIGGSINEIEDETSLKYQMVLPRTV